MRFEIGPGGMLLILLGLAGLSAAVFGLGLVAGHELSGPEPGSQAEVAAYPLPPAAPAPAPSVALPAPAEASAPAVNTGASAASASPNNGTGTSAGTAGGSSGVGRSGVGDNEAAAVNPPSGPPPGGVALKAPLPATMAPCKPATLKNALASRRSRPATAATGSDEDLSTGAAVAPPAEPASASAEPADTSTDEEAPESAPEAAPAPPRRRLAAINPPAPRAASGPYSVQIDAMMDLQGAQEMARRIKAKGFQPFVVRTEVDGKTWYRLRVGHYATPEDAQAAESRLHQEFNQSPPGN